jgi:opacity protein-like surface antigen
MLSLSESRLMRTVGNALVAVVPASARRFIGALLLGLLGLGVMTPNLFAQSDSTVNHLYDKFEIGAYAADVLLSTTIRIDNADGTRGTDVSLGTLGIPTNAIGPIFDASWKPGKRHELQLSYLGIGRSGTKTIVDTIFFADTSFAAGAKLSSKFDAPTVALTYRFAFMAKPNTQLGVQVGLGLIFFSIGLDALGAASTGGADTATVKYSADQSLAGPTASLGVFGKFRVGKNWYLEANGGAIGASVSNISATTWTIGGGVRYFFSNLFGLDAGYNFSGIKVTIDHSGSGGFLDPGFSGKINYTFQTFRLGAVLAFH